MIAFNVEKLFSFSRVAHGNLSFLSFVLSMKCEILV